MGIDQMELTFLGTSAGKPTKTRNVSSFALRMDGSIWLFDCGEATQHQLLRVSSLRLSSISKSGLFFPFHGEHFSNWT